MKQKWKKLINLVLVAATLLGMCSGCAGTGRMQSEQRVSSQGEHWNFGFGKRQILPDENSRQPLYIAGYQNGAPISDVLDYCEARALWLDTGEDGVLLIGIDCVAIDSGTVKKIRKKLKDLTGCASIQIYSTHTHAGPDTLGLWGPVGVNGKNRKYMKALIQAAAEAGREAYENRKAGTMYYGKVETKLMYRDSRDPQVYDPNLYQLRLEAADGTPGVRMYFYGAHAESLRGANTKLSRDFPGQLCDRMTEATGDNTLFAPGAIGGLIMTREFTSDVILGAVSNLKITSDWLVEYAQAITPETERQIPADLKLGTTKFIVPMDNFAFLLYRALGILTNDAARTRSKTGYGVRTELSVMMLGDLMVTLIPGEIFPELVYGGKFGDANPDGVNPRTLYEIAGDYGMEEMLIVGLANDEIGYIVPPSDFLVHDKLPYIERIEDKKGEDHYEETNSVGPECAGKIAEALECTLNSLFTAGG